MKKSLCVLLTVLALATAAHASDSSTDTPKAGKTELKSASKCSTPGAKGCTSAPSHLSF